MIGQIGATRMRPGGFGDTVLWPIANKAMWWRRLHRPAMRLPLERFGDRERYKWPVLAGSLSPHSIVYSFGIGTNASFELELQAAYGCDVHAFDPTPRSVQWARAQAFPPGVKFYEWGLGPEDGDMRFAAPANPGDVSYSALAAGEADRSVVAQVRALASIMSELRHPCLDVLKMDIEGCEYAVLDRLAGTDIRPRQLLVEFHQGFYGCTAAMTRHAVAAVLGLGYAIFWVSDRGLEYGFVRCEGACRKTG